MSPEECNELMGGTEVRVGRGNNQSSLIHNQSLPIATSNAGQTTESCFVLISVSNSLVYIQTLLVLNQIFIEL